MQNKRKSMVIGLTGNIASGKTAVSKMLCKLGAIIIDADNIARNLVKKDMQAWGKIKNCFGDDFFFFNGELDRKKMGEAIFGNKALKEQLDGIMFPAIRSEIEKEIDAYKNETEKVIIVIDAALLLEAGWNDLCDEIWLVKLDPDIQLKRLMSRDDITRVQAQKMMNSQLNQDIKLMAADRVIDNSRSLSETEEQVNKIWIETN